MSELTREDCIIILQFGIHIAKIDGDFDVWEKKVLKRFADAMGLTEQEKTEMLNKTISLAHGLEKLSSIEARSLLLKTLCAVSDSDGEAHETEIEFINKVIEKLGSQVFVLPRSEWKVYQDEVISTLQSMA